MTDGREVRRRIVEIVGRLLSDKGGESGPDIATDVPLFAGGLGLDSADSLHLVVAIEDDFEVEFDDDELTIEVFENIDSLAEAVLTKLS